MAQVHHWAVPVSLGLCWLMPSSEGQAALPMGPCLMSLQSVWLQMLCAGSPRSATAKGTAPWLLTRPPLETRVSPA